MMSIERLTRLSAVAAIVALCGTTQAAPYVPATDPGGPYPTNDSATDYSDAAYAASKAGQYVRLREARIVRGSGGNFRSVQLSVPVVLDSLDPLFNGAVAEMVDGQPRGAVSGFIDVFPQAGDPNRDTADEEKRFQHYQLAWNWVLAIQPQGNDVIVDERLAQSPTNTNSRDWSNTFGSLLSDGTALFRSNFNSQRRPTQNNIEFININSAAASGGTKLFFPNFQIDDFDVGSIFLPPPSGVRADNGDLLVAQTNFSNDFDFGAPNAGPVPYYLNVWRYSGSQRNIAMPDYRWPANAAPTLTNTTNVSAVLADYRPGGGRIVKIANAGCNTETFYTAHAYGAVSAGAAFSGGGFNSRAIYVDVINAQAQTNGFADGVVAILPNPIGGPNATYTPPPTNTVTGLNSRYSFATAQSSGNNHLDMFDINSKGQVVAVFEDNAGPSWQIRLYNPIFDTNDACKIVGYQNPIVILETGVSYIGGLQVVVPTTQFVQLLNSSGQTTSSCASAVSAEIRTDTIVPFSGVGIDDDGNVSFIGSIETFTQNVPLTNNCNMQVVGNGDVLRATTNAVFYYHAASDSVHLLAKGGQNGDVINPKNTAPANTPSIQLGFFPLDQQSDTFGAESFSDSGGVIAATFRDGNDENGIDSNNDGYNQNGGTLAAVPATGRPEQAVRGVVLVQVGPFSACTADANTDGIVNGADLSVLLGSFNQNVTPGTGADFNNDGVVNGADLSVLLGQFNCPFTAGN